MRRRVCLALALALGACGKGDDAVQATAPATTAPPRDAALCALGGSGEFRDDCTIERGTSEGVAFVVVHHPDGGFRRLLVSRDGQALESADGAQATRSARKGDRFEVILGDDRYIIPMAGPDRAAGR